MCTSLQKACDECAKRAMNLVLRFEECSNEWYAEARGQGRGEFLEVKHVKDPDLALDRLVEKLCEHYPLVST